MILSENHVAFGAPGIEPRWTSSAKEGVGTAYHTSCRLWFTISHGIVNEIYYPHVDQPNTRDFQFLITDGETFCHEEKRDLDHQVEYPEHDCLLYRLTNSDPEGHYRLVKHVMTDPHRSVLITHTKVEVLDEALSGKLRLYALLAPQGADNSAWCSEIGGSALMHAQRGAVHLVVGSSCGFARRSVGYVGASDGWQDLMGNYKMDWEFRAAERGNIALTGEIVLPRDGEFTIAIACGGSYQSTVAKLLQSLADPFETHRQSYVRQWQRAVVNPKFDFSEHTCDGGGMYRLSRCVLLAHEDKIFQGAMVASMSIPWGETKSDNDRGGYHLVWTRDLVQSATALLATGQTNTPLRALIWLAAIQHKDGSFPQNSWIDGTAYWSGVQLDEIAAPLLLAWRLYKNDVSLNLFNPRVMMVRAAAYLILQGPVTCQERWEENAGYSPSTLATVIAALVCAAELAREHNQAKSADFILAYADWLAVHLEEWMVTTKGELVSGFPHYYIRINPTDAHSPDPHADPNTTMIQLANGGGLRPARNVVGGDFLHLVRLGIRSPNDPIIRDSIKVIDGVIKLDLSRGPGWRRYNHDGYGQKDDGSAFDGTGVGRCWPILTGERGHYELAAGRDPKPFIVAMESFANEGGMLTEQLWDADDLVNGCLKRGFPTGAAMPLCWSHAEYISLVRSRRDGVCFDRVEPAFQRYVANPVPSRHEIWSLRHRLQRMPRGKILRIILPAEAVVVWSTDGWAHSNQTHALQESSLNLWFADFPTADWAANSVFEFTLFWKRDQRWEGRKLAGERFMKSADLPTVYLARHGETAWSLSGQHTGLTDLPLTERGERNARRLGEHLAGLVFKKVFTSPLQRARRTCELAGFGEAAEVDRNLAEWNYGDYEGLRTPEIHAKRPDWQLFRDGCPGGESPDQIGARADEVVNRLRAVNGNALVFSSGHFLRVLAARWLGLEPAAGRFFVLNTASVSALGYENSLAQPAIRLWNDTGHLDIESNQKSKT